jgi:hypothetical protein
MVETCTVSIFKEHRSIAQWVKQWWEKLHVGNIDDFTGLSRNQHFTLLETFKTPVGTLRVVLNQK